MWRTHTCKQKRWWVLWYSSPVVSAFKAFKGWHEFQGKKYRNIPYIFSSHTSKYTTQTLTCCRVAKRDLRASSVDASGETCAPITSLVELSIVSDAPRSWSSSFSTLKWTPRQRSHQKRAFQENSRRMVPPPHSENPDRNHAKNKGWTPLEVRHLFSGRTAWI